jgi:hypothetical protein
VRYSGNHGLRRCPELTFVFFCSIQSIQGITGGKSIRFPYS